MVIYLTECMSKQIIMDGFSLSVWTPSVDQVDLLFVLPCLSPSVHWPHIVLHLNIYIAPLALYSSQRRFQCERPSERRGVLREERKVLGSSVIKEE